MVLKKDPNIEEIKKKLDVLLVLSRRDPSYQSKYNDLKKEYDRSLISRKKLSLQNQMVNSDNKNKTTWSIVKSLTNRDYEYKLPIEGNLQLFSNDLNKYFVNIATVSTSNIPQDNIPFDEVPIVYESLYLKHISLEELKTIIKSLKNKHTSGVDGISNNIIKITSDVIIEPIQIILNNSMRQGVFPDELKTAIVKPIYKKGDVNEYGNYRPIKDF